jgi:hypothetical protein
VKQIWKVFPQLTKAVRQSHVDNKMAGGHPFDHVLQVAQCAYIIAETEDIGKLAGAAGLCHNADRILQKSLGIGRRDVPEEKVIALMQGWLDASAEFTPAESGRIVKVVLRHSGPNLNDGDDILVALQDADRITCSMADAIMGAGQYWHDIPPIDPRWIVNPADTDFRHPKCVARDLVGRRDWIDPNQPRLCVRLPKAKELMARRVAYINWYLEEIRAQRAEVGLSAEDYPFDS